MSIELIALLAAGIFVVATLYSEVGRAGASNASWPSMRMRRLAWRAFRPLAVLAIPALFAGSDVASPAHVFALPAGVVLIIRAAQRRFAAAAIDGRILGIARLSSGCKLLLAG